MRYNVVEDNDNITLISIQADTQKECAKAMAMMRTMFDVETTPVNPGVITLDNMAEALAILNQSKKDLGNRSQRLEFFKFIRRITDMSPKVAHEWVDTHFKRWAK